MIGLNNKKIGFIVDSSSNIKDGSIEDVKVIPLGVSVQQGTDVKTFKDGINFSQEDLKTLLPNKEVIVRTSQAAMPDMMAAAEEMCSKYDQVFVFPIHKNLSGNVNTWNIIKEDYPNLNVIMSCDITDSFIWTIDQVKKYLETNEANQLNVQKFVDEKIIPNRIGFLMVQDLEQLVKGGRVGRIQAVVAKLLKINPVVLFSKDGLKNFEKTKDNEGFFTIADQYIKENFQGKKPKKAILIVPFDQKETTDQFVNDFKQHYGKMPYSIANFPTVVVCHTGLKHIAIYFSL